MQSAINMQSLFETYKGHVMYPRERILFRLFQGPVKRIRIFFKTTFFLHKRPLYLHTKLVPIFPHYMIIASVLLNIFGKFKLLKVLSETVIVKGVLR